MTTGNLPLAGASLLDPAVLARIGNLELIARVVVEGFINGLHRSPHLGSSMDFAEHRAYMPGDDIRRIDWRLYARSDRYFVKEFEADTNTNFVVLLDVSASMRYAGSGTRDAGGGGSKLAYAAYLTACVSYLASLQRDRVGLVTFDDGIVEFVPPSAKHFQHVLHALDRTLQKVPDGGIASRVPRPASREGSLSALKSLTDHLRRRSIVVLVSDLYEEPDAVRDALGELRGRGNDLIVFHVLDSAEREFPFMGAANFQDVESGERLPIVPEYLRDEYRRVVADHIATLRRSLRGQRIGYELFDTSQPLDRALFSYLAQRERMRRTRA